MNIRNMQRAMLAYPGNAWIIDAYCIGANPYRTKMGPGNHTVCFSESQIHVIDPTTPGRALADSIEHRLHVGRRAADDAEHLGGCRLMLQRLTQFCIALLDLLEEAHILDGDYGLVGEGFEE